MRSIRDQLLVDALNAGQSVRLRASTRSMFPAIEPGDLLIADAHRPIVGEVAVSWQRGQWVTHRVVAITEVGYQLLADSGSQTACDVKRGDVFGRVVKVEKGRAPSRLSTAAPGAVRLQNQDTIHRGGGGAIAVADFALRRLGHLDSWLSRTHSALHSGVGGFLSGAFDLEELSRLGINLYSEHMPTAADLSLWAWEEPWFERWLPKAPAHILVGAAGAGREVEVLEERGYRVHAFEPAPNHAATCTSRMKGPAGCWVGRYEDLIDNSPGGRLSRVFDVAERDPYDAVILGWTSLSHVLGPEARHRLLETASRLAPHGPVLASFWGAEAGPRLGRSWHIGRRLGELRRKASLAMTVGASLPTSSPTSPTSPTSAPFTPSATSDQNPHAAEGLTFLPTAGFLARISEAEMQATATALGRTLTYEAEPYARAVLSP